MIHFRCWISRAIADRDTGARRDQIPSSAAIGGSSRTPSGSTNPPDSSSAVILDANGGCVLNQLARASWPRRFVSSRSVGLSIQRCATEESACADGRRVRLEAAQRERHRLRVVEISRAGGVGEVLAASRERQTEQERGVGRQQEADHGEDDRDHAAVAAAPAAEERAPGSRGRRSTRSRRRRRGHGHQVGVAVADVRDLVRDHGLELALAASSGAARSSRRRSSSLARSPLAKAFGAGSSTRWTSASRRARRAIATFSTSAVERRSSARIEPPRAGHARDQARGTPEREGRVERARRRARRPPM